MQLINGILKSILIAISVLLIGLMVYASIAKIPDMIAARQNPDLFNPGSIEYHYRENQPLAYLHIFLGIVFLVTGAYQLIPYFRNRYRRIHRMVGRLFLLSSLLVSLSAILMSILYPYGDRIESVTSLVFGIYLLAGTFVAYRHAVHRRITSHKRWVLRVYFVSLSIASIRVVAATIMFFTGYTLQQVLGVSFAIAFAVHLLVVEGWIRWRR